MKKKWIIILLFFIIIGGSILSVLFFNSHNNHKRDIILYGASPNGKYTKIMNHLAQYLNCKLGDKYTFKVKTSEGSVRNIHDLQTGKADIALVQEDVAHYFYYGDHPILKVDHRKDNKVRGVCFFTWEYLFVCAKKDKKSLADLKKIHIGSLHGGSGVTAINLREQLQYKWKFVTNGKLIDSLLNNKVDAIMFITSDIKFLFNRLKKKGAQCHFLSLSNTEIASIVASFPFYHEVTTQFEGQKLHTIATRSLLAVNKNIPTIIVSTILEIFTDPENYQKFIKCCPEVKNIEENLKLNIKAEENIRFKQFPLPMHPLVFELQWGKNPYKYFWISIIITLLFCILIIYLKIGNKYRYILSSKDILGIPLRSIYEETWQYFLLLGFILIYLILSVYLIKYLEIQAFIYNKVSNPSKFVSMGFRQLITWVIVFTVTGYEDEVFPLTELGKLVASSIRLVTIGGVMFIIGRISADYVKSLVKGRKMEKGYNLKDHIVICNWNEKGERIIEELHSPLLRETDMVRPIIVICDTELKFPDTPEFEDTFCIPGSPTSNWKLRNANVQDAFAIIILANKSQKENADTQTIMIAMEISDIVEEMLKQGRITKKPHISAEIIDNKKAKYFQRAGVNEIISSNDIGVRLLAQTAVTPGITGFMKDILQYSADSNEIYIVPPPKELLGKDFLEISLYFLKNREKFHQAILVGIFKEDTKKMLVNPDKNEFSTLSERDKLVIMAKQRPILE